ncbi:hypothetical protein E9529_18235 [Blastococcus sp. KM273128]|nr:hypothetical protein [Blastococcus sp. KM273128]
MLIWWMVLVAGVILSAVFAFGTTLAYGDKSVPRRGFWPDLSNHRAPWWTWVALAVGIALMVLASMRLTGSSETSWRYLAYFLPSVATSWLAQMAIVDRHNRRVQASGEQATERP